MEPDALLAAAAWIGRHALPLFLMLLGGLLLAVGAVGWGWQTHVGPRARAGLPQPALLLLGAALAVLVGAANVFADVAERVGDGNGRMALFDEALAQAIGRHTGLGTLRVLAALTRLGDGGFLLLLLAGGVALWLWRRGRGALALAWLLALGGNAALIPVLKRLFERVRPVHDHGLVSELGWSFPSGHSAGATVAYGMPAPRVCCLARGGAVPPLLRPGRRLRPKNRGCRRATSPTQLRRFGRRRSRLRLVPFAGSLEKQN